MAKRKRSKRTEKTSRTSKALRVDSSLLTTLIDEIDELVELLRFLVSPENVIRSIPAWRGVACQRSDLAQSVRNLPTPRGGRRFTQPGAQDSGGRERLKSARSAQAARR